MLNKIIGYMIMITSVNYVMMSGELGWLLLTLAGAYLSHG
jgi:hypothetical protein